MIGKRLIRSMQMTFPVMCGKWKPAPRDSPVAFLVLAKWQRGVIPFKWHYFRFWGALHPSQLQESVASRDLLGAATWSLPCAEKRSPRDALRGASVRGVALQRVRRSWWRKWTGSLSLLVDNLVLSSRIHQHQPRGPPQLDRPRPARAHYTHYHA